MTLRLLSPDERPALAAGQPLAWSFSTQRQAGRSELRQQARLLLTDLLSHYLDCPPERLGLVFEAGEPPGLATRWQNRPLALSISYCATRAAIAICPGTPIGIDLSPVTSMPDWRAVARLYLGPAVESRLALLPAANRDLQFAQAWATQEACLKALGLPLQEWSAALQQGLVEGMARVETLVLDDGERILALACARA